MSGNFLRRLGGIRRLGAAATMAALLLFLLLILAAPLPSPLFRVPYATPVYDRSGALLSAAIAEDEQWRFPPIRRLPERYRTALLHYEDRRYPLHPGVDPLAIVRALRQNAAAGEIVSGASTITMQTVRLMRMETRRTLWQKAIEAVLALKLELFTSKAEILRLYASHAPFGGNTVGLSAAAWRYFGRPPGALSWSEAALLAILPNSPSWIFPGSNQDLLLQKRNRLLRSLHRSGAIDADTLSLALAEPLPEGPRPLPRQAPHLLTRYISDGGRGTALLSSLDRQLQRRVSAKLQRHHQHLRESGIHNAAAVVLSLKSGEALAYAGNVRPENDTAAELHHTSVDIISAPRSPGSLLKPFLYALALDDGMITPDQLIPDIPMFFKEFVPRNYSYEFNGAVPASRALIRSLNVPFVYLAREYDYTRFYRQLGHMGLSFPQPAAHYGISLILGGAEASLWDLSALFAGFGRSLLSSPSGASGAGVRSDTSVARNPFFDNTYRLGQAADRTDRTDMTGLPGRAGEIDLTGRAGETKRTNRAGQTGQTDQVGNSGDQAPTPPPVSAGAVWSSFEAMKELVRPGAEESWRRYASARPIAWKTGTSMGFKDAWSVGVTPNYVVGVWIGNADGEGRPGINGLFAAAPLLFDLFDLLPREGSWFSPPLPELEPLRVCTASGMEASGLCPDTEWRQVPAAALQGGLCPYHQLLHLDNSESRQVDSSVYPVAEMKRRVWFVLPPVQAWYYKHRHPEYRDPPPALHASSPPMHFIYPAAEQAVLRLPRDFAGTGKAAVFRVAHRSPERELYWHLDGRFLGSTRGFHEMQVTAAAGSHRITVVDGSGEAISRSFTIAAEEGDG